MADRAGSVISIQADIVTAIGGGTSGTHPSIAADSSIIIKVTSHEIDFEIGTIRVLTSGTKLPTTTSNPPVGGNGNMCGLVSLVESQGGVLRATGFVDPATAPVQVLLILVNYKSSFLNLKNVNFYIDNVSASPGSRYGYDFGLDTSFTPTNTNAAKLIPLRLTGRTNDDGMQEIEFELHSQNWPLLFSNNL